MAFLTALLSVWNAVQQVREQAAVKEYLSTRGLLGMSVTRANAIAVSDAVRADFLVDEARWKRLSMSDRPFLRHDTITLLDAREGLCGEGARVIVNLLLALGFDATRIVLYDKRLRAVHALVSVVIDGKELLVDSINSPSGLNAFLRENQVGVDTFDIVPDQEDILTERELGRRETTKFPDPRWSPYWLYSYEGVPLTKLARVVGLNVRAFNHTRPTRMLSALAEKPHLLLACVWGIWTALLLVPCGILSLRNIPEPG